LQPLPSVQIWWTLSNSRASVNSHNGTESKDLHEKVGFLR